MTEFDVTNLPEIADRRLSKCHGCREPLGFTFWLLKVERGAIHRRAAEQRAGFGLMLGSPALADVFASQSLARQIEDFPEVCLCEDCACTMPLAALLLREDKGASTNG